MPVLILMWTKLARLQLLQRCSIKSAVFAVVVVVVLFPHPVFLGRQVRHLRDMESLIQPALPAMAEINHEIDQQLPAGATPKAVYKTVERYVYDHVQFQYDWDNWVNVDYWPTAAEVWERRREDCDGRAVLAVSILRSRGFTSARLEGNITHVWVAVDDVELMGPEADKNFRREGDRILLSLPSVKTMLEGMAMIHEFPPARSLIVLFAALVLCFHPCRSGVGFGVVTLTALGGFVFLMHWAGLHLGGQVKGINLCFVEGAGLLMASVLLAILMPRLVRRVDSPVACGLALPDSKG